MLRCVDGSSEADELQALLETFPEEDGPSACRCPSHGLLPTSDARPWLGKKNVTFVVQLGLRGETAKEAFGINTTTRLM